MSKTLRLISLISCIIASPQTMALDFLQAVKQAQLNDPELQAAEYKYQSITESYGLSLSTLLPQLQLSVYTDRNNQDITNSTNPSYPDGSNDYDNEGYTLSLSQSIYNHSFYKTLEQTDINIAAAKAEIESARQAMILRVATAYYNVLAAEDNVKFSHAEKIAIGQQLEQTRKRFNVGLIAITDVKESQAQYDLSLAREISANNQFAIDIETLRSLIGDFEMPILSLNENIPLLVPQPENIEQWVETAKNNNLSLKTAQFAFDAAQKQISIDQSGHYPTLDLAIQRSDTSLTADLGDRDSEDTSIRLQLNIPIYSGGYTSAKTKQSTANMEQARALREKAYRQTIQQSRTSYLGITASIAQVNALKQALISTQTAHEATEAGFKAGTRTAVDVLASLRELYRAERDYAEARYTYILNLLKLKQAAGILSENDAQQINQWLKH